MDRFDARYSCRGEWLEDAENRPLNDSAAPTFRAVCEARFDRRSVLRGALGAAAAAAMGSSALALMVHAREARAADSPFGFAEIAHGVDETHHVAPGHSAEILIRWGDPVLAGAPDFDPMNQSAAAQAMQFGYNNDYIGFVPLAPGADGAERGLLCVNHEYTSEEVMFPGLDGGYDKAFSQATPEIVAIEMAAHGGTVLEIARDAGGAWRPVAGARLNRRITAGETEMILTGPAAGHARLKTKADPSGTRVIGTVNNCAGGITPWGTYLMAEENFHAYFMGSLEGHAEARNFARYGVPGNGYAWGLFHDRFDIAKEPNEANRFGWVVEVDPLDPASTPRKRTALGRFKHEGAETIVNGDGRVVAYMGDDQRSDYLYKFVSEGRVNPADRAANMDLLDSGTLSVAKFHADGTMSWLPLVFGEGPLTPENGFESQADVLIETRLAADLLGATPMDRPEDVQPNPATGKVYVLLTNNSKREAGDLNPVNDRPDNLWGQIVEISPRGGDHAAAVADWSLLVKCGDPTNPATGAVWNAATSANGWFACPDNAAADGMGRLWVSTDQGGGWKKASGTADGLWGLETEGEGRGAGRMFFRVPVGAELCGPLLTADSKTLFLAVQHPATDGVKDYPPFARSSTFADPATRWPDFKADMPPRPSIVVVTKDDGGIVGG
jgi:secreted PhoX family phosphatase